MVVQPSGHGSVRIGGKTLTGRGIKVAMGHTNATGMPRTCKRSQVNKEQSLHCQVHIFNGMRSCPLRVGNVGAALIPAPKVFAELICRRRARGAGSDGRSSSAAKAQGASCWFPTASAPAG